AAFGSDLDAASRSQLERGSRLVELLKQPQYSPFPVEQEDVSIWAGTTGQLDDVPVADIRRFEKEFLEHLRLQNKGILDSIAQTKELSNETAESLTGAIAAFKKNFETSEGKSLVGNEEADDLDESTMSNEKVRKHVPPAAPPAETK
ncbi:MAG TPA: F0F1 ATP synthase subunit alpha, partial [Acidothermaceae bacterium]|nr:F0F1 ATP synthase subunit alpha [Acidothermaceae bacterium]